MPYIDREKFRMHIIRYQRNPLKVILTDKEKEKFIRILDEVPTADVQVAVQVQCKLGKWIDQYQDGDWHCSCCGAIVEKEEQTLHNWYFCYHCGSQNEVEK